jgi:hypothetical protein
MMKYINSIINKPMDEVISLFDSFDNMRKWQPELQTIDHFSGTPGEVGAKTRLVYQHGKRTTEMIETVKVRNLPEEISGSYETKGVINHMYNSFRETSVGNTEWYSESEFIFTGFMKYIAWMMKGSFKKMSFKFMKNFKEFAESN